MVKVVKAVVLSNYDVEEKGTLQIQIVDSDGFKNIEECVYVSPYYANYEAGIIAIPERNSEIIVTTLDNDPETWYFQGCIVEKKEGSNKAATLFGGKKSLKSDVVLPEEKIYSELATPKKLIVKTPLGHCLTMSDNWNDSIKDSKIELRTAEGSRLLMHDSQAIGAIKLENAERDGITIATGLSTEFPSRSIECVSEGNQVYKSFNGTTDIIVDDGGELNIRNNSTGMKWLLPWFYKSGNVNISSKHRDINITNEQTFDFIKGVYQKQGSIYVHAGKGLQLECTEGGVKIHGLTNVDIVSEGNINMESRLGSININAPLGSVNIKAPNLNMEGTAKAQVNSANLILDAKSSTMLTHTDGPVITPAPATPPVILPIPPIIPNANGDPIAPDPGI